LTQVAGRAAVTARSAGALARRAFDELFPPIVASALAAEPPDEPWCADDPASYCPRCGASAGPGAADAEGCPFCRNQPIPWQRLTRLGFYGPPLDERIRLLKFARQWQWADWFGEHLAAATPAPPAVVEQGHVVVCAVPMHWTRRCVRGFNQASLIAASLARRRGWLMAPLLRRTRRTPPQTRVAPSQRQANVRGSFTVEPVDLSGHAVVLVDDVKTSGATLSGCARLLRERGAISVQCAVVAVADPTGRNFTRL
jgi:ComF family protein